MQKQEWNKKRFKVNREIDEQACLKNKKLFLAELAEAVEELKLIKEGKIQANSKGHRA